MIIYKITNLINSKIYIGQTSKELKHRISSYLSEVKNPRKPKQRVISAMKKHGFYDFTFEVIDYAINVNDINAKEMYWIKTYNSTDPLIGYNVSLGGDNLWLNPEIKAKMIKSLKGHKVSELTRQKIAKTLSGHEVSETTRKKQSLIKQGNTPWNKGKKGSTKPNSGSFSKDKPAPNKGRKRILVDGKIKFVK